MNDRQLADLLLEKGGDPAIDRKIAVYINRLLLRLHSQTALLSNLADFTYFKPGVDAETEDQVEDGHFNESDEATNDPAELVDNEDDTDTVVVQLSFRRLPQEAIAPLLRLIAAPREPKLFRFSKDGSARFGVELELKPSDFPGEEFDYDL